MSEFPILDGKALKGVPWSLMRPHEPQALLNHRQTLARLAERGGLSPCEAIAVIEGRRWKSMDRDVAERQLAQLASACSRT